MPWRRWRPLLLLALLLAPPLPAGRVALAQEAAAARGGLLGLLPEPVTSRHELALAEGPLAYTATAGTLPLRDAKGEVTAAIFHVAYVLDPPDPARPVTFAFNGGPGAASAFLNLGAIGPRRVLLAPSGAYLPPPARLVDNQESWLAFTDLVLVDPVGTGYSRSALAEEPTRERFFGVRQDVAAMAAFIRLWLTRSGRTLSPLFLAGESYGGFRAARLARTLPEETGLGVNGILLLSPALDFSLLGEGEGTVSPLPWVVTLPSLAAVHRQRQQPDGDVRAVPDLADAESFALGDYLLALAGGTAAMTPAIERRVQELTGLAPEVVRNAQGRISAARFAREYARAQGRVLSRYDGMADGPDPSPADPRASGPDPVLDRAMPVWTAAMLGHVAGELGYRTDVSYRLLDGSISGQWDYGTTPQRQGYAEAMEELQAGRVLNPALEVLIAHGDTDLVTPYLGSRFLLAQQAPLAGAAAVTLRVYPGGHMFYMAEAARRALQADARQLYGRALAATERP